MNVYFIDPQYVKPEGWHSLLSYLKVKAAYSFIPNNELPTNLVLLIKPYLKSSYSIQNYKKFCDNCAFWLKAHFEKHIHLITDDFGSIEKKNIPEEELKKYSSNNALRNIVNLDDDNCLILLNLKSSYDKYGNIEPPVCYVNELQQHNLITHIAEYCLNILHKKYGHWQYREQSAFICFDKYFSKAYKLNRRLNEWHFFEYKWDSYDFTDKENRKKLNFMGHVNHGVNAIAPELFPLIKDNEKKRYTKLRTEEGEAEFKQLLADANEAYEEYLAEEKEEQEFADAQADKEDLENMLKAELMDIYENGGDWILY